MTWDHGGSSGQEELDKLTDEIYEAAIRPEAWSGLLGRLAIMARSESAHIFTIGSQDASWVSSPDFAELAREYLESNWPERTDRAERIFRHPERRFLVDPDVYTREQLRCEPVYHEFLIPHGMGWGAAAGMTTTTGEMIVIDIERSLGRGIVEPDVLRKLDALRPHLARAVLLSGKLGLSALEDRGEAFESIGLPAAILGRKGHTLVMNARMRSLMPRTVVDTVGGLAFVHGPAQASYREAIRRIEAKQIFAAMPAIPIPGADGFPAHVAYVMPMRRSGLDMFTGAVSTIVLSPIIARTPLSLAILEATFGLTHAEARVTREIASGSTVEETAKTLGVSSETVRVQLKSVFRKTGTRRQLELATLVTGPTLID